MNDVFISYKSEEIDEASWVKSVLENNGISCWMAPSCIPGGSSYAVEIPHAIKNAKVLVLILSAKSQSSPWVSREIDLALNEGKVVLPFMLENCALKDDFNFYLTNVQRYAAYENKAAAMEKMIREIKAIIGVSEVDEPETAEEKTEEPIKATAETQEKKEVVTEGTVVKTKAKYDILSIISSLCGVFSIFILGGTFIIPDIMSLVFALLGIKNIANKKVKGKNWAITGHILGCISLISGMAILFAAIGAVIAVVISVIFTVFFIKYFKKI